MNKRNQIIMIFAILVALMPVACFRGDQQEEANRLTAEGNRKLEEARSLFEKTERRNTKLFGANIQTIQQLKEYKISMNDEAKSIITDYTKVSDMLKDISVTFGEAARLNTKDLYKQYAKLKSDELIKRAEAFAIRRGNAQAFIEIDSPDEMNQKLEDNNERFEKLLKEADGFGEEARQMEYENKEFFKESNKIKSGFRAVSQP